MSTKFSNGNRSSRFGSTARRWSRNIHRDLSFLFSGVVLVYAASGFMLNHKRDFNADYDISRTEYRIEGVAQGRESVTKESVLTLLEPLHERESYTKHYFPSANELKVFLKGGSSLSVDLDSGAAVYESVRKRPLWSGLNRLHYNPGRGWTIFSDLFVLSLIVITLTGMLMMKGNKGLWGRGGVEFLIGLIVPILFITIF